jgi:hypothetical protein
MVAKRKSSTSVALLTEEPSYLAYELARIRSIVASADRLLKKGVSPEIAARLRELENPWTFYLAPLRHWPSSLVEVFGTGIIWHPYLRNAIDRLLFEAGKEVAFLNPPERVVDTLERFPDEPLKALWDERPSSDAEEARVELARIFKTGPRGRPYPNSYLNFRRLVRFESLYSAGLSEREARSRIAAEEGVKSISRQSLKRGREMREDLLQKKT